VNQVDNSSLDPLLESISMLTNKLEEMIIAPQSRLGMHWKHFIDINIFLISGLILVNPPYIVALSVALGLIG